MRKTLTALLAAGALLFAACGDDDGGGGGAFGGGDTGESGETGDPGAFGDDGGDDAAASDGDAQEFCEQVMNASSPADAAGATPPAEIAEDWAEVMDDPNNPDNPAVQSVGEWIAANCDVPGLDSIPESDLGS